MGAHDFITKPFEPGIMLNRIPPTTLYSSTRNFCAVTRFILSSSTIRIVFLSIDEPLNVDWDGNELLLSDILGTDEDVIYQDIENEVERKLLIKAISKLKFNIFFRIKGVDRLNQSNCSDRNQIFHTDTRIIELFGYV